MANKKEPKVVIAICTCNRCKDLERLLQSLAMLDYENYRILVIDNNSTDNTKLVTGQFANVDYVLESRQGIAYARNTAIDTCENDVDYLAFLDDDETVEPDWLIQLLDQFTKDENIVAVGGPYQPIYEETLKWWMTEDFFGGVPDDKEIVISNHTVLPGGNAAIKVEHIKNNNIRFDEKLSYHGKIGLPGEDVQFYNDLIYEPYKGCFVPTAAVKHYIGKGKMTFQWFWKRYFAEGVTQYYRYGNQELARCIIKLPMKVFGILLSILTFNRKKTAKRFWKTVNCVGTCLGPFYIKKRE